MGAPGIESLSSTAYRAGESPWRAAWRGLLRNPSGMAGLAGLALFVALSLAAPWAAPLDPTSMDLDHMLAAPGPAHPFGTDDLGRDILSRVIWGGRESLRSGLLAVAIAVGGGAVIGLISGYYGGLLDGLCQRVMEVILAFPSILLTLSIVAVVGPGLTTALVALGVTAIPWFARIARASTLTAREMEYVMAARALGAGSLRIIFRHILPNVMAPIITSATLALGYMIMAAAGLSYLGLGAQPPSPEWGAMLNAGRSYLRDAWWLSVFPGLAIFVVVLCVNLLGDSLATALNPKGRR